MTMATGTADHGRIYERPGVRILDTRSIPWESFAGLTGAKVKVLSRDDAGRELVFLVWMPPGELPGVCLPHRHYHRTVREYSLIVSGELPHWEYKDTAQQRGDLVVFREGYFMERHPGSIHGLESGLTSANGCTILMWRDGVGNWVNEPEAEQETIDVAYDDPPTDVSGPTTELAAQEGGVVLERPDVTIRDTRAMPWEPFDGLRGGKVKVLARDAAGHASVFIVWMPPGHRDPAVLPHRHYHRTVREFAFMLSGELPHWEYTGAEQQHGELVIFREGFYMDRLPGSLHGSEPGVTSPTGCTLLMWRNGVGNWLGEPEATDETIEVPYTPVGGGRSE